MIRAAVVGYQVMDSSRRGGIAQKLSIENIYQVAGHLVHGKLVPPYPPSFPPPQIFLLSAVFSFTLSPPNHQVKMKVLGVSQQFLPLSAFVKH